jgi:hypothetical protein
MQITKDLKMIKQKREWKHTKSKSSRTRSHQIVRIIMILWRVRRWKEEKYKPHKGASICRRYDRALNGEKSES